MAGGGGRESRFGGGNETGRVVPLPCLTPAGANRVCTLLAAAPGPRNIHGSSELHLSKSAADPAKIIRCRRSSVLFLLTKGRSAARAFTASNDDGKSSDEHSTKDERRSEGPPSFGSRLGAGSQETVQKVQPDKTGFRSWFFTTV